jgi:ADP-ribose pyrophosphatase YjhB (NUDIX family)
MPHIHDKIDFVSDIYIVNGDAVLLRLHDKYKTWMSPGGHIELDEGPAEAVVREAKEEVGLDVILVGEIAPSDEDGETEILVPRFLNRHRINDTHEHISFVYFATADSRDFSQGDTELSDHIRWFTAEELDDPAYGIKKRIKMYAKAALNELGTRFI